MNPTIDWPVVIADLAYLYGDNDESHPDSRIPCSEVRLADHLGVPRTTLRNWLEGSEPKHGQGEALLERWCQLSGKAREFAPLMRRTLSAAKVRD